MYSIEERRNIEKFFEKGIEIKEINKALQMLANKKGLSYDPLKWQEIYTSYEEIREKQEVSTDDDGRG